ncbi:MAG: phage baseplate assembly protein V [Nitrospinota bacterium]|nr:phage baseplate assembly protein V [Nitrospinota bacterium]
MSQYFGKYRGKVESNVDPNNLGRVKVKVPAVLDDSSPSWAMPCVPYAGKGVGFFFIPPKDANIWVEFEGGDPNKPIWTGCFWGENEVPISPAKAEVKIIKTEHITFKLDNNAGDKGGITLEIKSPAVSDPLKMIFDKKGITIDNKPSVIKLTQKDIELDHKKSNVKMTEKDITVDHDKKRSVKITDKDLTVKNDKITFTVTDKKAELKNEDSSIKVEKDIEIKCDSVKAKISKKAIEMENGSKKIKIGSSSVLINEGALEVM